MVTLNAGTNLNITIPANLVVNSLFGVTQGNFERGWMIAREPRPTALTIPVAGAAKDNVARNGVNAIVTALINSGIFA